jgi:hypothetical protein
MAKALALLALTALFFGGCASSPDAADGVDPSSPAPTFTAVADNRVAEAVTTDTYHLLERPVLTTRAPTGQEPVRVPIGSFFQNTVDGGAYAFADSWNTTLLQELHGFSGTATLVVEVTGTLVGDPRADLQGGGCFWLLAVGVGPYETGSSHDLGCVKQGTTVPAGLYVLEFPFALADLALAAGTDLHFEMHTSEEGPRAPGARAELLTASEVYDSTIQVYGLQLPLEPTLVLLTA